MLLNVDLIGEKLGIVPFDFCVDSEMALLEYPAAFSFRASTPDSMVNFVL